MVQSILKWKLISFIDLKFYLPCLHINQNMVPIMFQIMKVENIDTVASCNQYRNNSKQETKRTSTHRTIENSHDLNVVLNKWLAATLREF